MRRPRLESTLSPPGRDLAAFVAERFPFALPLVLASANEIDAAAAGGWHATRLDAWRGRFTTALSARLAAEIDPDDLPDTTPGIAAHTRLAAARRELVEACDGHLRRRAIAASLTADERREILRGMVLTRAVDNRLKQLFTSGDVRWGDLPFPGKGFRSLGQEAVYAAAIRLKRGPAHRQPDGTWRGDVVAPVIRDLGVALAMRHDDEAVRMVLNAQVGKAGPPMAGKDLHIGDFGWGVLPPAAPLAIASLAVAGMSLAFWREGAGRVAVSFIGEGGSSLGEWHEAINLCAARRLPAIFCIENNQTALSTPVRDTSAVRVFADKAAGYGVPGITIDGTDPDAVAAAFTWAAERARAGEGVTLIELVTMRMCGHAHHDDMRYLGKEPASGWTYPTLQEGGYADPELHAFWAERDPIARYADRLRAESVLEAGELDAARAWASDLVDRQARAVLAAPWPDPADAGVGVFKGEVPRVRVEPLARSRSAREAPPSLPPVEPGTPCDPHGRTFLDGVMLGIGDALAGDPRVFVYGEDVGGTYGNAFLLLRPLLEAHGDRILNSPLAENAVLGVCIGAALAGQRPIGEMQFNDFVASGFNQLVNSAAKIRYRWGGEVPMVVRMPWGGLRNAGPFHSQNTEAWFYRTPGLKIVVPSTPEDARTLMAAAVADPDPVLYYEHIALYREPSIRQRLATAAPSPIPIGRAALRRAGSDLALISYGAYVHRCLRVAEALAAEGLECAVLDLRSLMPLDRDAVLRVARYCSKVLFVQEDARTGSIGESVAAVIQEEAFAWLDAPVRVLGALDTPVPYSPPLEAAYLVSDADIERAARRLIAY